MLKQKKKQVNSNNKLHLKNHIGQKDKIGEPKNW